MQFHFVPFIQADQSTVLALIAMSNTPVKFARLGRAFQRLCRDWLGLLTPVPRMLPHFRPLR